MHCERLEVSKAFLAAALKDGCGECARTAGHGIKPMGEKGCEGGAAILPGV